MPLSKTYRIRQLGDSDKQAKDIEAETPEAASYRFSADLREMFEQHNGKPLVGALHVVVSGAVMTVLEDGGVLPGLHE
jgi:hypothetical protein